MQNPPVKRGSWLVTLALAGGGLTYLFCAFLPTSRAIHALREEIRSRQSFGAQSPVLAAAAAVLQKKVDETKRFVAESRRQLPDGSRLPELGSRMTKQADLAGARTTHFEPQPAKDLVGLRMVPIAFNTRGSFGEINRLLAGLEMLPERLWLDELRIEPARESGKDAECILKLTVFAVNSEKSD